MTDLEITRLCATAMGYKGETLSSHWSGIPMFASEVGPYDPLHDDAQAMALVKKLWLSIQPPQYDEHAMWHVWRHPKPNFTGVHGRLNRAICECVAKMQAAK